MSACHSFQALSGVANACQILPNVVTGGQPTADQLQGLKAAGGDIVLDLRDPMEPRPVDEAALVRELGMEYVNIPVRAGSLDDATLEHILAVLRRRGRPYRLLSLRQWKPGRRRPHSVLHPGPGSGGAGCGRSGDAGGTSQCGVHGVGAGLRPPKPALPAASVGPSRNPLSDLLCWSTDAPLDSSACSAPVLSPLLPRLLPAQAQSKPHRSGQHRHAPAHPARTFFQFANGGWLKRSKIPGDLPRWGSFNELQEQNYAALQDVLTDAARNAPTDRRPELRGSSALSTAPAWIRPQSSQPESHRSHGELRSDRGHQGSPRRRNSHSRAAPAGNSGGLFIPLQPRRQEEHPHHRRGVSGRTGTCPTGTTTRNQTPPQKRFAESTSSM